MDVGVYTVRITATLTPSSGPATSIWDEFTLTIVIDCPLTTLTDKIIINMANTVSATAVTQDVSFADSKATLYSNPTFCGARTYTFIPPLSFLILSGTNLSLSTTLPGDVGIYPVDMTVKLTDYSGVPVLTKSFKVTITCVVSTITFSTPPALSTTLQVGIDTQPKDIAFATSQTPDC